MPDETTGQEGSAAAPEESAQPEFDPSSVQVDVAGRKMSVADLTKSYTEAEKTMREAQQNVHTYKTQLDGYSWANDLQTRYQQDASFRQALDDALEGHGRQPINELNPAYQEVQMLKQEHELMKMERDFDKLKQQGYELDKNMETELLQEMAMNRYPNVEVAYKAKYFEKALAQAREQATSQTAEQLSENQSAYKQPAKGITAKSAPPNVKDMTPEQRDAYLQKRINEMDMFSE
jgi:hypothetical protein